MFYRAKGARLKLEIWGKINFSNRENPTASYGAEILHIKVKTLYVVDYTRQPV